MGKVRLFGTLEKQAIPPPWLVAFCFKSKPLRYLLPRCGPSTVLTLIKQAESHRRSVVK